MKANWRRRLSPLLLVAVAISASVHGSFAWVNRDRKPDLSIIDPPPGALEREAMAFGDHQFLYRAQVLELQNAGDTGGRSTPLNEYNYDYVVGWLRNLGALDPCAIHHDLLATRLYAWGREPAVLRKLVDFIVSDVANCPQRKWYWQTQAIAMANHRLNDQTYGLALARQLAAYDLPDMPFWIFLYPAVLLADMGQSEEALREMEEVRQTRGGMMTAEDKNYLDRFEARLRKNIP